MNSPRSAQRSLGPAGGAVWRWACAIVVALCSAAQGDDRSPSVYFDEADATIRSHLQQAEEFLAHQQWDEAIDRLRAVMDLGRDQVIAAGPPSASFREAFGLYVPASEHVQHRLATLHAAAPAALAHYRAQVDPLAEQWLAQAVESNDAELLRRIVDRLFLSRAGDEAALRLGDLELERGHYTAARSLWERLHPSLRAPDTIRAPLALVEGASWWMALRHVDLDEHWAELAPLFDEGRPVGARLAYPDTDIPLAQVWARLALVSALEGSSERARLEAGLLRRLYPEATGAFGGKEGRLADLAAALVEQGSSWPAPPQAPGWPTFAGAFHRAKIAPEGIDVGGGPLWRRPLSRLLFEREPRPSAPPRVAESARALLASHPVIVDGVVWTCDFERIFAIRLEDGKPAFPTSGDEQDGRVFGPSEPSAWIERLFDERPRVGSPRFTLTIHKDKVYARLGWPQLNMTERERQFFPEKSYLVGIDRRTLKLLHPRIEPDDASWAFEGTPVVDDEAVYVVMRRTEARSQVYVACYDGRTGALRWRQKVCSAPTPGGGRPRIFSHNLLTREEDTLYLNTNLGAVAALSAEDGAIRWLASYPRIASDSSSWRASGQGRRDLTPCVAHQGLLYLAPSDSDRIFALDAQTGQMRWTTPPELAPDASHLLGVGEGKLIASGVNLYWLDALTGRFVGQFPQNGVFEPGRARASPGGYGRGILAGSLVWWPTREKIYLFEQAPRREGDRWTPILRRQIELSHRGERVGGGNLTLVDGALVIATDDELLAFNAEGSLAP